MKRDSEICECNAIERLMNSQTSASIMPLSGEYAFKLDDGNAILMRFCFSCGGMLKTSGVQFYTVPDEAEMNQALELLKEMESASQIETILGKPDQEISGENVDFRQGEIAFCRQLVYRRSWRSFDLFVLDETSGGVRLLFGGKYQGPV